ncbi:phospholipase A2 group XV-like [Lineus longissimus]|uniref:phospholipase A2 group XV-like n=1 Tax=Lineus longissimus TaxID=88925 RepID=UPI002B4CBA39
MSTNMAFSRKVLQISSGLIVLILVSLFLDVDSSPIKDKPNNPPVILIPGDGGSQLEGKLDKPSHVHFYCERKSTWFPLWLNLELIAPLTIDCLVDNLRLDYNPFTRTTHNPPGVEIRIQDFGNTSTVEYLDASELSATSYYAPIVADLVKHGYKRGITVRGAPFDFRKAANELQEYFKAVKALIEETYTLNGDTKVVVIAHSMGNIVFLYFLNHIDQLWKDKYISSYVSLAGPWAGAAKTVRIMASGDNLGVFVVETLKARVQQRTMPSTAWMMPSERFWKKDEVIVYTPYRNYTVYDYKQFFADIKFPVGYLMRQDTEKLIDDLRPPGVEHHCLHGSKVHTPGAFRYTKGMFPDTQPYTINEDGDGTVNMRSLLACLLWKGKQKQPTYHKVIEGTEHLAILDNLEVLDYLHKVLGIKS